MPDPDYSTYTEIDYHKSLGDYYDNIYKYETMKSDTPYLYEADKPVNPFRDKSIEPDKSGFESVPVTPDIQDLSYAQFAKSAYNPLGSRKDINNYDYIQGDSTEKIATYANDVNNELVFAIKGSNPDDPVGDFYRNSAIALGSAGLGLSIPTYNEYKGHIDNVKKKYPNKKVVLTGHSQGGSFANMIGVDAPDYKVITYNMGTGLPFISNSVKCKLGNCDNIKNYRVVGDWASVMNSGSGNTFQLRPKNIDETLIKQAEEVERFYLPSEVFQAHGINQFIDRVPSNLKSDYGLYGRKLAGRVGAVVGVFAEPYLQKAISEKLVRGTLPSERGTLFSTPPRPVRQESVIESEIGFVSPEIATAVSPGLLDNVRERLDQTYLSDFISTRTYATFLNRQEFASKLLGFSAGEVIGGGLYDLVLKPSESQLADF